MNEEKKHEPGPAERRNVRTAAEGLGAVCSALRWNLQGSSSRPMPVDFADAIATIAHAAHVQGYNPYTLAAQGLARYSADLEDVEREEMGTDCTVIDADHAEARPGMLQGNAIHVK